MKKIVACIMLLTLLFGMTACGQEPYSDSSTKDNIDNITSSNAGADEEISSTQDNKPQNKPLSCDTLIAYARDWAREEGLSFDFVSDIIVKPGEAANETKTTFSFYAGFATANVSETNGLVQTVTAVSFPSKIAEAFPSNTSTAN